MRVKLFWVGMALATVATCRVGTWMYGLGAYCPPATGAWSCHQRTMLLDTFFMALPLGVLTLRGAYVGLRQLRETQRAVHHVLAFGRQPLAAPVLPIAQSLGIASRIDVVVWNRAEAFCYGLLHPRICITTGLLAVLEPDEVEAVLRHERHHVQRHDPLRTLLWTMLCGMCWWLRERAAHADLLRELAADRAVIEQQGRTPLARALLKLLTQPRDIGLRNLAISSLSVTDARIDQLLASEHGHVIVRTPQIGRWILAPCGIVAYVLFCSVIMAHL